MLNATFKRPSLTLAMEFGSLKELAGYIQDEGSELCKLFGDDMEIVVKGLSDSTAIASGTVEAAGEAAKKRGRPAKDKSQPDSSTAQAPAPVAIPGAPVDATLTDKGLPAFLDRAASPVPPAAAPVAPAAPPPPPPAPVAPVAPPSGILAGKVIAELEKRKAGSDENAKMLVDWLAAPTIGLVTAGASFDDAIAAVRLMPDDKLGVAATALAVS